MIRKLFEAFFGHKLLLLLPPLLIPGIVTPIAFMSNPPLYESSVSVWIDRPAYLNYKDGTPAWISEVQNQSGRLNELLHTRAFVTDVAQRTSLAPLLNSAAGQARINDLIAKNVIIGGAAGVAAAPTGAAEHLLVIRVQSTTAQLAYDLCNALVTAYQEKTAADQLDQAGVAADFYQSQVQDSQQKLSKASQDLRGYVLSHPTDPADSTSPVQAAMLDPKLASLQSGLQAAQVDFNNAQTALKQAQQDATMSAEGRQYGFQVMDAPQLPTTPTAQIKKILIYPIAAAVAGLVVSALLLVLLVAADRSIRSEFELAPNLRMLGMVPMLKLKRVPKRFRSVATRRAIGATAGTALPASGGTK